MDKAEVILFTLIRIGCAIVCFHFSSVLRILEMWGGFREEAKELWLCCLSGQTWVSWGQAEHTAGKSSSSPLTAQSPRPSPRLSSMPGVAWLLFSPSIFANKLNGNNFLFFPIKKEMTTQFKSWQAAWKGPIWPQTKGAKTGPLGWACKSLWRGDLTLMTGAFGG